LLYYFISNNKLIKYIKYIKIIIIKLKKLKCNTGCELPEIITTDPEIITTEHGLSVKV